MIGIALLSASTFAAGFAPSMLVLDICRATQGLAVASYTPSCIALFSSRYPNGQRKNVMLGIYGAFAPIGFFVGIAISASLRPDQWQWYFWAAAALALLALFMAYLCTPIDKTDRNSAPLTMDWAGCVLITSGLILMVYALKASSEEGKGWKSVATLVCFSVGASCLLLAIYVEGWVAKCPLIPFAFFKPHGVKPFVLASLFFYGCFGIWLFTATEL